MAICTSYSEYGNFGAKSRTDDTTEKEDATGGKYYYERRIWETDSNHVEPDHQPYENEPQYSGDSGNQNDYYDQHGGYNDGGEQNDYYDQHGGYDDGNTAQSEYDKG